MAQFFFQLIIGIFVRKVFDYNKTTSSSGALGNIALKEQNFHAPLIQFILLLCMEKINLKFVVYLTKVVLI